MLVSLHLEVKILYPELWNSIGFQPFTLFRILTLLLS
jgi:hypothetical protein